jgi:hypothetical protein
MRRMVFAFVAAAGLVALSAIPAGAVQEKLRPAPGKPRSAPPAAGANTSRGALGPRVQGFQVCNSFSSAKGCIKPYTFGVPHGANQFIVTTNFSGMAKGGSLQMNFLASDGQPLTDPVVWKVCCPNGRAWTLPYGGPFPPQTIKVTFAYNGKPLQGQWIIRFL